MLGWLRRLLRLPASVDVLPEFLGATLDTLTARFETEAIANAIIGGVAEALQQTRSFGNYRLGSLKVDFLFANGPLTQRMLESARPVALRRRTVRLALPEDLVGLKLKPSSALSEAEKRELLDGAANPLFREMSGPPCGKTADENFEMMSMMLKFLCSNASYDITDRPLPSEPAVMRLL